MSRQSMAQMDADNRALAYLLRHPPAVWAVKPLSYGAIAAHHVIKADGSRPDRGTVRKAVKAFKKLKKKRGRACGWRKTTSEEDATILSVFRKLRPPGHGVTAPDVHRGLPLRLRRKLSVETVRLRLAAKGYHYFEKMEKNCGDAAWRKRRFVFCKRYASKSPAAWARALQAVADLSLFTYYPKVMRARYNRLQAARTYMTKEERRKPAFQRPKPGRFFKRRDYKKAQHLKVFDITLASRAHLVCPVRMPFDGAQWAALVRRRVGPFVRKHYRGEPCTVLLDGEKLLHTPEAKAALRAFGMRALPNWPSESPDLNPQENVWPWIEKRLRNCGELTSFEKFKRGLVKIAKRYPAEGLVASTPKRLRECVDLQGGMTGH